MTAKTFAGFCLLSHLNIPGVLPNTLALRHPPGGGEILCSRVQALPPAELSHPRSSRSAPMDFALNTYMSHAGIRLRETRPSNAAEKAQSAPDKDKWLPFFPKTKKVTELPQKAAISGCGPLHLWVWPPALRQTGV